MDHVSPEDALGDAESWIEEEEGDVIPPSKLEVVLKERDELEAKAKQICASKLEAADQEDFMTAAALKKEETAIRERLRTMRGQIEQLKEADILLLINYENQKKGLEAKKTKCVEKEDFDGAQFYKERLEELEIAYRNARANGDETLPDLESLEPIPAAKAVALYNYTSGGHVMSSGDRDLSIKKGQICTIVGPPIKGWIKVEVNGEQGMVPVNYLQRI